MSRFPRSTMGAFLLGVFALAPAAVENVAEPPEEITVTGKSLAAARSELHRAQERVFTVFNSLNSDDEYDIHCEYRTAAGSHIRERVCEANFFSDATSAEAIAWLMRRGAVPAWAVILHKKRLLHKEMVRLAYERPEFLESLEELAAAHDRAESLQHRRRAGR